MDLFGVELVGHRADLARWRQQESSGSAWAGGQASPAGTACTAAAGPAFLRL